MYECFCSPCMNNENYIKKEIMKVEFGALKKKILMEKLKRKKKKKS